MAKPTMLDQDFHWQIAMIKTPNPSIREIRVTVHEGESEASLENLTSYIYAPIKQ
jgi:hypothetical protein